MDTKCQDIIEIVESGLIALQRTFDYRVVMTVSVEIPDDFARRYHLNEASRAQELLEAFLLQRYVEGELTAGQIGEVLGLSFQETEQFLHDHKAPGLTPEQNLEGVKNLERLLSR
jgi:hypothetical protein